MKEQILAQFDTQYQEYKNYKNFLEKYSADKMVEMKNSVGKLLEKDPVDLEDAVKFVIEYRSNPIMFATDLDLHKERVLSAYQVLENAVEFPQEIKTEMKELQESKRKPIFIIDKGVEKIFNQAEYDFKVATITAPQTIKATVDSLRNIQKMQEEQDNSAEKE